MVFTWFSSYCKDSCWILYRPCSDPAKVLANILKDHPQGSLAKISVDLWKATKRHNGFVNILKQNQCN